MILDIMSIMRRKIGMNSCFLLCRPFFSRLTSLQCSWVHVWACVCSLGQIKTKSLVVVVKSPHWKYCVQEASLADLFSSLGLLFALSTPDFHNFTSMGFSSRDCTCWGFTLVGEGSDEQITCCNMKSLDTKILWNVKWSTQEREYASFKLRWKWSIL